MGVTEAGTNGGKRGRVHSEFDDGYAIGYFDGCDYVPIVFSWEDAFGCEETEQDTGFRARISFGEGCKRTMNWWKEEDKNGTKI